MACRLVGAKPLSEPNDGLLLIGPLGTTLSETLNEIHIFSSKKTHMKVSSVECRPFCLGLNVIFFELWMKKHIPSDKRFKGQSRHRLIWPRNLGSHWMWSIKTSFQRMVSWRRAHEFDRVNTTYLTIRELRNEFRNAGNLNFHEISIDEQILNKTTTYFNELPPNVSYCSLWWHRKNWKIHWKFLSYFKTNEIDDAKTAHKCHCFC